MMPVTPPMRKAKRKPTTEQHGVVKVICPCHMVPIQLKNLMPVGTAINRLRKEKKGSSTAPVVNMWCAHTPVDRAAMAMVANTMPL